MFLPVSGSFTKLPQLLSGPVDVSRHAPWTCAHLGSLSGLKPGLLRGRFFILPVPAFTFCRLGCVAELLPVKTEAKKSLGDQVSHFLLERATISLFITDVPIAAFSLYPLSQQVIFLHSFPTRQQVIFLPPFPNTNLLYAAITGKQPTSSCSKK